MRHAIDSGYRFYSYGDASLLFRKEDERWTMTSTIMDRDGVDRRGREDCAPASASIAIRPATICAGIIPTCGTLLPEKTEPSIAVPPWPKFMRGCIRYRQSLDRQAPDAPVYDKEFDD